MIIVSDVMISARYLLHSETILTVVLTLSREACYFTYHINLLTENTKKIHYVWVTKQ